MLPTLYRLESIGILVFACLCGWWQREAAETPPALPPPASSPPASNAPPPPPRPCDWLLDVDHSERLACGWQATVSAAPARYGAGAIQLSNGLVTRIFATSPNFALLDLVGHDERASRGLGSAEGLVSLNGRNYTLGGLDGHVTPTAAAALHNLTELKLGALRPAAASFRYLRHRVLPVRPRYPWTPGARHSDATVAWPPRGVELQVELCAPTDEGLPPGLMATLSYEAHDGLPVTRKQLRLAPLSAPCLRHERERLQREGWPPLPRPLDGCVHVGGFSVELLRLSPRALGVPFVDENWQYMQGRRLSVFAEMTRPGAAFVVEPDREYPSSIRDQHSRLHVAMPAAGDNEPYGPLSFSRRVCARRETEEVGSTEVAAAAETAAAAEAVETAAAFASFGVLLLLHDSADDERVGLGIRRMHRTLTPQMTENPLYMHCTRVDSRGLRRCLKESAEAGFEMVLLSFGTGIDLESRDEAYRHAVAQIVEEAHSLGLEFGAYDLLAATRARGAAAECVRADNTTTGDTCLASAGGEDAMESLLAFVDATGVSVVEIDGPYEGALCASTRHRHHQGLRDSALMQWQHNMRLLRQLAARGVYLLVPDPFFYDGTHKIGVGYDEEQFSLPKPTWLALARQQMFDNSYDKLPSQGWGFVPLEPYKGGGKAAALDPMSRHLRQWHLTLAAHFGYGVQPAYRGWRLFDSSATKRVLMWWVSWFKRHRVVLNGDLIHGAGPRPDADAVDHILHVQPSAARGDERALLLLLNPADAPRRALQRPVPLRYANLRSAATCAAEYLATGGDDIGRSGAALAPRLLQLDSQGAVWLPELEVPAQTAVYFVFREADHCAQEAEAAPEA